MKFLQWLVKERFSALDMFPVTVAAQRFGEGDWLNGIFDLVVGLFLVGIVTVLIRFLTKGGGQ